MTSPVSSERREKRRSHFAACLLRVPNHALKLFALLLSVPSRNGA
jgi:hypothetical protein